MAKKTTKRLRTKLPEPVVDDSETERDADVALRVLKRQSTLNRYDVRAVSQLSKAARAAFLPLPKPGKIRQGKPLKV